MKIHPRYFKVNEQRQKLSAAVLNWAEQSDLTMIEIAISLQREVDWALRYALREERHGNLDKKADEA